MKSLNRVTLLGNLASDPDPRTVSEGVNVVSMSVATNRSWVNKEGEISKKTEFHRVSAWRKLAEVCEKWLKKGSPVYLEGFIQNKSYESEKGVRKFFTEIVATDIYILKFLPSESTA